MRLKRVISCFLHRWDAVKVCPKNLLCLITINSRGFHSFTVTVTQKNIFYDGLNFTFHCVMKHAFFVFLLCFLSHFSVHIVVKEAFCCLFLKFSARKKWNKPTILSQGVWPHLHRVTSCVLGGSHNPTPEEWRCFQDWLKFNFSTNLYPPHSVTMSVSGL